MHLSTGSVSWFGDSQGLTGKSAFTIRFDREHRLWAATDVGLFVSSPPYDKFSRITDIPQALYWTVTEDSQGVVWAGGGGGLYGLIDGHWHNWSKADGLEGQSGGARPWRRSRRRAVDRLQLRRRHRPGFIGPDQVSGLNGAFSEPEQTGLSTILTSIPKAACGLDQTMALTCGTVRDGVTTT